LKSHPIMRRPGATLSTWWLSTGPTARRGRPAVGSSTASSKHTRRPSKVNCLDRSRFPLPPRLRVDGEQAQEPRIYKQLGATREPIPRAGNGTRATTAMSFSASVSSDAFTPPALETYAASFLGANAARPPRADTSSQMLVGSGTGVRPVNW